VLEPPLYPVVTAEAPGSNGCRVSAVSPTTSALAARDGTLELNGAPQVAQRGMAPLVSWPQAAQIMSERHYRARRIGARTDLLWLRLPDADRIGAISETPSGGVQTRHTSKS